MKSGASCHRIPFRHRLRAVGATRRARDSGGEVRLCARAETAAFQGEILMPRIVLFVFAVGLVATLGLAAGCGSSGGGGGGPSSDANLSALAVSVGSLTPAFDPATTAYTAAVGLFQTSATVTPTAADPGASITVDGSALASGAASATLALATGPNPVMIVVTAADGTTT